MPIIKIEVEDVKTKIGQAEFYKWFMKKVPEESMKLAFERHLRGKPDTEVWKGVKYVSFEDNSLLRLYNDYRLDISEVLKVAFFNQSADLFGYLASRNPKQPIDLDTFSRLFATIALITMCSVALDSDTKKQIVEMVDNERNVGAEEQEGEENEEVEQE